MVEENKDLEAMLGTPKKAIMHMAVPLFFSLLVTTLQSFIDGIWCSGLGPDPLSAIAISGPVHGIIVSTGAAMGVGASAAIARALGASDKDMADRLASQAIVMTVLLSLIAMPIVYLAAEPIISVSGGGYNIDISMEYVTPYIICAVPLMFNGLVLGLIRSEGAAKKSTLLAITTSVLNMVLDPIMIYTLDLGVMGAAWATCISFIATSFIAVYWYLSKKMHVIPRFHGFRFDKPLLRDISIITIPVAVEMIVMNLLIAPEQSFVAECGGSDGLVVYINAFRYVSLVMIPANAIGSALIPVVSAQIGQKAHDKVWGSFIFAIKVVFFIEMVMGLILFIFADFWIDLYTYSGEMAHLHEEMVLALRIYSVVPIFNGLMRIGTSMLQSLRKAVMSTILMFVRELLFLSFYWIASKISMTSIYWSLDLTNLIAMGAILILAYYMVRLFSIQCKEKDIYSSGSK